MNLLINLIKDLFFCFVATFFFSYLMSAPKKAMFYSSVIAALGYLAYDLMYRLGLSLLLSCFVGTLIIAITGEIAARIIKMPATLFIYPAVIPLVPGIGIYETMLYLIQNDYASFGQMGAQTLFIAGVMAAAIAVTNLLVRIFFYKKLD